MSFPKEIQKYIADLQCSKDDIGKSEDSVYNFENKYILKISSDIDKLKNEQRKNDWIVAHIPGPKSLCFVVENGNAYYLRECLVGESLISAKYSSNPLFLISILEKVFEILKSLDVCDCPFKADFSEGNEFVHGDICLPNIFLNEKDEFIGFIDVGESGIGDRYYDVAWLIWSFEHNTRTTEYTDKLLKTLGFEFDEYKYQKFVLDNFK